MSLSAFGDKAAVPDDGAVATVLEGTKELWDLIRKHVSSSYDKVNEEWKFYSKSAGWTLVVRSGKRALFYLIPVNGHFKVNFVFGGKAAEEAAAADIPDSIKRMISEAAQYAEGRSFMTDVKERKDADAVIKLIDIKDRN